MLRRRRVLLGVLLAGTDGREGARQGEGDREGPPRSSRGRGKRSIRTPEFARAGRGPPAGEGPSWRGREDREEERVGRIREESELFVRNAHCCVSAHAIVMGPGQPCPSTVATRAAHPSDAMGHSRARARSRRRRATKYERNARSDRESWRQVKSRVTYTLSSS